MADACTHVEDIRDIAPSGDGCAECLHTGSAWVQLRRCTTCGHVGCCDSSPNRHATAHNASSGHPLIQSFEPGENWYWCFVDEMGFILENQGPSPSHS
jgi:hypothetical protein